MNNNSIFIFFLLITLNVAILHSTYHHSRSLSAAAKHRKLKNSSLDESFLSSKQFDPSVSVKQPSNVIIYQISSSKIKIKWIYDISIKSNTFSIQISTSENFQNLMNSTSTNTHTISNKYEFIIDNLLPNIPYFVRISIDKNHWVQSNPASITLLDGVQLKETFFQNGKNNYFDTKEVVISTQYIDSWNLYNGVTYGMINTPYTYINGQASISNESYNFRTLIRFDNLNKTIPKHSIVAEASIVLNVGTWSNTPVTINGKYLNVSWEFNQTKSDKSNQNKKIGWSYRGPSLKWTSPGALNDTHPNSEFLIEILETASSFREIPLDLKIVQKWINNPEENNGLILYMVKANTKATMSSITGSLINIYPMLKISYYENPNIILPNILSPFILKNIPRDIYVNSLVGNDELNNGDFFLPIKTMVNALNIARPNDIIYLYSGIYDGGLNIARPNITITSVPGNWGIISSPLYDPQTFVTIYIRETAHYFHLSNIEITGGYHFAVCTSTSFENYLTRSENELLGTGPLNLFIDGCKIHDTGSSVIKFKVATGNAIIINNEIYNSGQRSGTYGHGFELLNVYNVLIEDNHIHDLKGAGVKTSGGTRDLKVSRNLIERVDLCGILLGFYEEIEYMYELSNRKWYECIRCQAVSNIISDSKGCGIGFYAAKDSYAVHNTLYSVGQKQMVPILINGVQHWENNTANGSPICSCINITLANNIAVKSKAAIKGNHLQIRKVISYTSNGEVAPGLIGELNSSNNLYFSETEVSGNEFKWGHGVMLEDENPLSYFLGNITGWFAKKGWDNGSFESDPKLNFDFTLLECSPAISNGIKLNSLFVETDYDGQLLNSNNIDIGARQSNIPFNKRKPYPPLPHLSSIKGFQGPGIPKEHQKVWPYDIISKSNFINYYVTLTGSDSNNGTFGFPLKTIRKALEKMLPGDITYIRNGVYIECLRIQTPNITLQSYPGELAVIKCPNFESQAIFFADSGNYGGAAEITLRKLEIIGGYYSLMFNQIGGGTSNEYWRWVKKSLGIFKQSITLIEDCIIHDSGANLIKLSPESNDIVFKRVEVYNSGLKIAGSNAFDIRNGNNIVIQDCYIHDVLGGNGILIGGGARNSIIERNFISNIGGIAILIGSFETETLYMRLQENPELYQAIGTIVSNNIIYKSGGAGIGLYSAKDSYIVHNTILEVAESTQAAILFNISPNYIDSLNQILPPCVNNTILNNIFTQSSGAKGAMLENRVWTSKTSPIPEYIEPKSNCSNQKPIESIIDEVVSANSGPNGTCPIFPPSHPFNQKIDNYTIHPRSSDILKKLISKSLHPDFGGYGQTVKGPVLYGIPITKVNNSTPKLPMNFYMYPTESDLGSYPLPLTSQIEGAPLGCNSNDCSGDRHTIAIDTDNCIVYETWRAEPNGVGWNAANGAIFNLRSNKLRPLGWTSADAAGLSIYAGLIKYDEVQSGEINHAMRITFQYTSRAYVLPATHYAAYEYNPNYLGMGYRIRLNSNFNCDNLKFSAKVICNAFKKYGAIVADNGQDWYLTGEAHPNWNLNELSDLKLIPTSLMEVVYTGEDCLNAECTPVTKAIPPLTQSAVPDINSLFMDSNIYFKSPPSEYNYATFEFVDRDPARYWRNTIKDSLQEWNSHTNFDFNSFVINPNLTEKFQPTSNSLALLMGKLIPGSEYDFFGFPRLEKGGKVDIGAISVNKLENSILVPSKLMPDPSKISSFECNITTTNEFFVSPKGNDSICLGNINSPFLTIKRALKSCLDNCVIWLEEGIYEGGFTLGKNGVTLKGISVKKAIIRQTFLKDSGDAIAIRGNSITLENLEIIGGYYYTISINSKDINIKNCIIHGAGTSLIVLLSSKAHNIEINKCTFRNSGQRVPRFGDGIRILSGSKISITENNFTMIRSTAIHLKEGANDGLIVRNIIMNSQRGIFIGNDNANKQALINWDTYESLDETVCYWYNQFNPKCHAASDVIISSNLIVNSEGAGIGLAGVRNISLIGNTLIRVASSSQSGLFFTAVQHYVNSTLSPIADNINIRILNNIILLRGESQRTFISSEHATNWESSNKIPGMGDNFEIDNNIYYRENLNNTNLPYPLSYYKRAAHFINRPEDFSYDSIRGFISFSQWKSNGLDISSFNVDPLLDSNFKPKLGSPSLLSASSSIKYPAEKIDLVGSQRNIPSDIGAIESSSILSLSLLLTELNRNMASPGGFLSNSSSVCNDKNCWHPWLNRTTPLTLTLSSVLDSCLNDGLMFPLNHEMNKDISQNRVHPNSAAYLDSIGLSKTIHPDFGTLYDGGLIGIPYSIVDKTISKVNVLFRYDEESDKKTYPIPDNAIIEGGAYESMGDRHVLILAKDECTVYELFKAVMIENEYREWLGAAWTADSGAIFNMKSLDYRPLGYTSTDAAGLSIFAGLIHYDEIKKGEIKHAIRFTIRKTQKAYLFPPATHYASSSNNENLMPMGTRMRLKASFDCNILGNQDAYVICKAFKKYGLILADNGGDMFVTGAADSRWNDNNINLLKQIPASYFEVVDTGSKLCTNALCN